MTLMPVHTAAELLLLRGPQPLRTYDSEPFGWVRGLLAPASAWDWNMLMIINERMSLMPERLLRLVSFYDDMLLPPPPAADDDDATSTDAKRSVRRALTALGALAAMLLAARTFLAASVETPWKQLPIQLRNTSSAAADVRAMQEWEAWICEMEQQASQTALIAHHIRLQLKRAAPADAVPPPAPKHVVIDGDD
jgi:hypothetical protein